MNYFMCILFLLPILCFCNTKRVCSFSEFDSENQPIFLQNKNRDKKFLMPNTDNTIFVSHEVIAYCPSGFDVENENIVKEIYLTCEHNSVVQTAVDFEPSGELKCKQNMSAEIFKAFNHPMCDADLTFYVVGLNISNEIFHLAEICFDLRRMETIFAHYIARPLSSSLQNLRDATDFVNLPHIQGDFSLTITPPNTSIQLQQLANDFLSTLPENLPKPPRQIYYEKETVPQDYYFLSSDQLESVVRQKMGIHGDIFFMKFTDMLPNKMYEPLLKNPFNEVHFVQRFAGWDNLIEGNWKKFMKLLTLRATKKSYEVYIGTSYKIKVPLEENCVNEIHSEDHMANPFVLPKIIWAYIHSKSAEEQFYVIGFNSPYYNGGDICVDICADYPWLNPLTRLRSLVNFGYINCCKQFDPFPA